MDENLRDVIHVYTVAGALYYNEIDSIKPCMISGGRVVNKYQIQKMKLSPALGTPAPLFVRVGLEQLGSFEGSFFGGGEAVKRRP